MPQTDQTPSQGSVPVSVQASIWHNELADAIRDPAELLDILHLPHDQLPLALAGASEFSCRVPRSFVARMEKRNPHDPLLLQVLPVENELIIHPGFQTDPVGDLAAMPEPGLLHKYEGRVLLVMTGACGIHCRYCFRRHFPYTGANPAADQWDSAIQYIGSDDSIHEVILSGGDPLTLSDSRLSTLAGKLASIPHVHTLRIHTRLPIVVPSRVDDDLCAWLGRLDLKKVIVMHVNHANEIDNDVKAAMQRLANTGTILLNQAVLLRNINDSVDAQVNLSHALFDTDILPYYLHLLDKVQGAAHFEVDEQTASRLMNELRGKLAGYLVPRLVRETTGTSGKQPIR